MGMKRAAIGLTFIAVMALGAPAQAAEVGLPSVPGVIPGVVLPKIIVCYPRTTRGILPPWIRVRSAQRWRTFSVVQ